MLREPKDIVIDLDLKAFTPEAVETESGVGRQDQEANEEKSARYKKPSSNPNDG